MTKDSLRLMLCALVLMMASIMARASNSYSNAVMALNPAGYWPLNETQAPPPLFVASNSGTLGTQGNAFYKNTYNLSGTTYSASSLFANNTPPAGATSDGSTAAQFNGGTFNNDGTGYMEIPDINHSLDQGNGAFTAEAWVMPGGGDPNDLTGASFASTEWAAIIKKGGGGAFYTENGDTGNNNTYGWTISLAGAYVLGPGNWGWDENGAGYPAFLQTNACWVVDLYNGGNGNNPSLEFDVPFSEPTPQWFHLALAYDGTNANFYVNGALAATTVPGFPQSTNKVISPNQAPFTSPTGLYQFSPSQGVNYAPDRLNPIVLGNINETYSIIGQGFPALNEIGFNCQVYNGAMDEVAVYTNALSAAAVLKHYQDATAVNTTLYTNDVLSAAPPVYLRFNEPASTFVEPSDFSSYPVAANYGSMASADGLYQPGVLPGTTGPAVAGFGSQSLGVQMNGFDAAVDVGAGALYQTALDPLGLQPFSVAYWFKSNPSDCYHRFQGILGRGDGGWRSSLDGGGHIRWNPGKSPEIASPNNYNDGAWHHVVGVSDGTNAYLYVDGALAASAGGVGALPGDGFDLIIGGAPDYTADYNSIAGQGGNRQRYFAGAVTQVAFFTNALAVGDVQTLYSAAQLMPNIVSSPQGISLGLGSSGSLSVTTIGQNLGYEWFQGSTQLSDVAGNIIGSTNSTLTITNAQLANGGNYTVVITNNFGSTTSAVAVVTIVPTPEIVSQPFPVNNLLYSGNEISFSLSSIGAVPLSYQWYRGNTRISGATGTNLVTTPPLGTNQYYCVVSNSYGSATSAVVSVISQTYVPPAQGLVANFAVAPGSTANQVYVGQGAYNDPGHNVWNPFPGTSGQSTGPALDSASNRVLVAASLIFGFNNGAAASTTNGTPSYLVSYEDAVNSGAPGVGNGGNPTGQLTINNLPQGAYTVYLYGANYDGDRGTTFSIAAANGGGADQGISSTTNGSVLGVNAIANGKCSFAEGDNYVFFTNVVADAFGNITVQFTPNPNPISGNTGEAPLNAAQVVGAPPLNLVIQRSGANYVITWTPATATLVSSTNVAGPYSPVNAATTPYTVPPTGTRMFFRVK